MTAPYTTGTITLTNGSATITGTGTAWQTALVVGGIVYPEAANGNAMPIATVDSDTKITAATKWKGATGTYPYAIVRDTDDGRQTVANAQALATYIQRLNNQMLAGLAALTPAANKLPYFGENAVPALADLSPYGQTLIAALSSSAAYGVLGTIPNAQLPTRLRELSQLVTDANAVLANGSYAVRSTASNIPEAVSGMLIVDMYDSNIAGSQYYVAAISGNTRIWFRSLVNNNWQTWARVPTFGTDNVIPDASLPARISQFPGTASRPTDADDVRQFGVVQVTNTTANIPVATAGVLLNIPYDNGTLRQIYFPNNADTAYYRRRAGSWLAWKRFDGDLSGPGAAVPNNALVGFNGTSGYQTKALTTLEVLANLGPVFGGVAPEPSAAGVGMVSGDFDTLFYPGVYTCAGNYNNGPLAPALTHTGILEVEARSYNNMYVQIFRQAGGNVFRRIATQGPVWQPWTRIESNLPLTTVAGNILQFTNAGGDIGPIGSGSISALHALTPAANKFPYFTSGNAAALGDITAFARSVLDDANGAAMFATMGATITGNANAWTATFPNGFKVQGGNSSHSIATTDSGISFTWPSAFSTICFGAMATAASHASNVVCGAEVVNLTGSQGWARHLVATNTVVIRWIGFGY